MIDNRTAASQAIFFNALGSQRRLQILSALIQVEVTAGGLANLIGMSQSATSQHLTKLRRLNLVTTRREAQTLWYTTSNPAVIKTLALLDELQREGQSLVNSKVARG